MSTPEDAFDCFGSSDSDESDQEDACIDDPELKRGRRLAQAANARQANEQINHLPLSSPDYKVFSCQDQKGYAAGQKGLRALRSYSAGDEILRESPTMRICTVTAATSQEEAEQKYQVAVQEAFDALSAETARAVMDLSSCSETKKTIVGIFQTNCYQLGSSTKEGDYGGLFLTLARINHSCRPNATHHWRPDLHQMIVHAARDIDVGDEIYLCYGPNDWSDTEGRRSYLRDQYAFECICDMCCEGNDLGGDDRMVELGAFHDNIAPYVANIGVHEPEKGIQMVDRCLEMLKEQGIGDPRGPQVKSVLHYGYQISLAGMNDKKMARSYLVRELQSVICSEGDGSYKALDIQCLLDELDSKDL